MLFHTTDSTSRTLSHLQGNSSRDHLNNPVNISSSQPLGNYPSIQMEANNLLDMIQPVIPSCHQQQQQQDWFSIWRKYCAQLPFTENNLIPIQEQANVPSQPHLNDIPCNQPEENNNCPPLALSFDPQCQLDNASGVGIDALKMEDLFDPSVNVMHNTEQDALTCLSSYPSLNKTSGNEEDTSGMNPDFANDSNLDNTNNICPPEASECTSAYAQQEIDATFDMPLVFWTRNKKPVEAKPEDLLSCTSLQNVNDAAPGIDFGTSSEDNPSKATKKENKTDSVLSTIQKKELRAQRNRESARRSRIKTKKQFQDMEERYKTVSKENARLRNMVEDLLPKCMEKSPALRERIETLVSESKK